MSLEMIGEVIITFVLVVASRTATIYNFCKIVGETLRDIESRRIAASSEE